MPTFEFQVVNVFAETTFGGNPLAVFPQATGLDDQQMQAIANQFNLSETTFVFPSERAAARVRIFSPGYEMAFAGHPTLEPRMSFTGKSSSARDLSWNSTSG
jgi:PhzF family phenazine biosynthesis protein